MRKFLLIISVCVGCSQHQEIATQFVQSDEVAIAKPNVKVDSIMFLQSAYVTLLPIMEGTIVRYNNDPSIEVTAVDPEITGTMKANTTSCLQFRAFHKDFRPSQSVVVDLRNAKNAAAPAKLIRSIKASSEASESYPGSGTDGLFDLRKGTLNFQSNNAWIGYQNPSVDYEVHFEEPLKLSAISVSVLVDQGSWIFAPKKVKVFSGSKLLGSNEWASGRDVDPKMQFLDVELDSNKSVRKLKVKIESLDAIPDWHQGKGSAPWLFIDEILFESNDQMNL